MANIEVLRQRVEDAERRLHSVQAARERECDALLEMWERIRAKFQEQEREIAGYRSRLSALQDMNVELTSMIDSILGSIEGSVTRSLHQIVPDITGMARELLNSEPTSQPSPTDYTDTAPVPDRAVEREVRVAVGRPAGGLPGENQASHRSLFEELSDGAMTIPDYQGDEVLELTERADLDPAESAPGIRNLISRIERAVSKASGANGGRNGGGAAGRDVAEIEHLRNELNGLRQRISSAGAAE